MYAWRRGTIRDGSSEFRGFIRTVSDGADVTFGGGVFHSREATTGKAR